MNNNYKMNNDTMTLFLATSILAIGGIGIYMFNTNDKPTKGRRSKKVEPVDDSESDEDESQATEPEPEPEPEPEEENDEDEQYSSKSRGSKTKKSRKQTKGTKRRY